jgi:hypothetical protein
MNKKIQSTYDKCDTFGVQTPSFNIKGREKVGTTMGCIFSLLTFTLVLTFAVIKST